MAAQYTDEDLDAAIGSGAITAEAAAAFRRFVEQRRVSPSADEESFRLITGFNDIFVSIAIVLVLVALGWLGSRSQLWLGSALVALASWGLAEFFTARRRMALPSIVLLIAFVGGVLVAGVALLPSNRAGAAVGLELMAIGAIASLAAYLHWLRFHVPITVAAGTLAAIFGLLGALSSFAPLNGDLVLPLMALCGLGVFALALWWDMSDPQRKTRRADVAFWLHLAAAPLIVHPAFSMLGMSRGGMFGSTSAIETAGRVALTGPALAVALYVVLALVALAVDRRALMVSALIYLLYAMDGFFRATGALTISLALSALIAGAGLLLLSAYWGAARKLVLGFAPPGLKARVPAA